MKREHRQPGQVTVRVKGKNLSVDRDLHDLVVAKMRRLDKYLDRLDEIEVELSTEHARDATHQNCVDATAHVLGHTIRVTAKDADMHAAVDESVDKLYRQLNRRKERIKSHHGRKLGEALARETLDLSEIPSAIEESNGAEPLVRIESLDMKPQFEDEALAHLESEGYDFYVFLNARDEKVNVLYRHPDGGYGLIRPIVG